MPVCTTHDWRRTGTASIQPIKAYEDESVMGRMRYNMSIQPSKASFAGLGSLCWHASQVGAAGFMRVC